MNTMTGILAICVLLIVWELSAISFTNQKILVHASIPSQKLGICLFAAASVIILAVRWSLDLWTLLTMAAIVAAALLNFAMKNGLSEYGMYINGWSTPYSEMKYYDFERRDGQLNRVRICCRKKDVTLLFSDAELEKAFAYFDKNKVQDMETYTALQQQAKARKKQ